MPTRRQFLASTATLAAALAIAAHARTALAAGTVAGAGGKRPLGRSGLSISPLVLGGNVFGWTADRTRSFALLDRFLDAGLETIDTADMYSNWVDGNSGGESETILGEWMASRGNRDRVVMITKVGMRFAPGKQGLAPDYIARAAEDSLRRLRTDHIDLYFAHEPDPDTADADTLAAFARLVEAGKVRALGASNFDAAQTRTALDAATAAGLPRYEVLQPRYNLYDRGDLEGPLLDLAVAEGLGVITYSSLASGFLTGKYRSEADLDQSPRGRGVARMLGARGQRILTALDAAAARHRAEPAEIALAWIMRRPGVTAPIASATSVEQLDSLVRAVELQLTDEDMQALDAASAPDPA